MDAIQVQSKQKQCINFELIKTNYNFSSSSKHSFQLNPVQLAQIGKATKTNDWIYII